MNEANEQKLNQTFCRVFSFGEVDLPQLPGLKRGTPPWDSLKHLELLNALELAYNIQFTLDNALEITDLLSARTVLEKIGGMK